jgi:hypothetical protein
MVQKKKNIKMACSKKKDKEYFTPSNDLMVPKRSVGAIGTLD